MSKQVHQYLMEDKQFRDMWATNYSLEQMVDAVEDQFNNGNFDCCIEAKVSTACQYLDIEMRQFFLDNQYPQEQEQEPST